MTELVLEKLPYRRNSASLLTRLTDWQGLVYLDSGLADRSESRYDIISALPSWQCRALRTKNLQLQIEQRKFNASEWIRVTTEDQILALAEQQRLAALPASDVIEQLSFLPFCGGLIGCLAYSATQDQSSGLNPNSYNRRGGDLRVLQAVPEAQIGLYQWAIIVDHGQRVSWLLILPECPVNIRQRVQDVIASPAPAEKHPAESDLRLQRPFTPVLSEADYARAFHKLKEWIYAGDCYQVNLAMAFTARFNGDPWAAYRKLRRCSRSPFSAFLQYEGHAVLSLSPERFLSVGNGQVMAQPIKGTRPRDNNPALDNAIQASLRESEKDQAENLMIVDLLRNDLGKLCTTGSVKVPALFELQSFSQVHHLVSTVTATLPDAVSPVQLLESCFPGGSITGAPKRRAMQIIGELEPVPRNIYCGSVFYCDFNNNLDSSICIRTLLAAAGRLFCWGGSGVVADSDCQQEYQECLDKVSALMAALSP